MSRKFTKEESYRRTKRFYQVASAVFGFSIPSLLTAVCMFVSTLPVVAERSLAQVVLLYLLFVGFFAFGAAVLANVKVGVVLFVVFFTFVYTGPFNTGSMIVVLTTIGIQGLVIAITPFIAKPCRNNNFEWIILK